MQYPKKHRKKLNKLTRRWQKIQESKERETELLSKKVWKKKIKGVQKKLIDAPYEKNIKTAVKEHASSGDYTFC